MFPFEDRYPAYAPAHGYGVTNEEPLLIRQLVLPFKRGLAIASAGEVTFLALLPRVKESLTLIDHSYASLRVFCLKALLLSHLGPVKLRQLFLDETKKGWKEAVAAIEDQLPAVLNTAALKTQDFMGIAQGDVRREWFYADLASLKRAAANLHKIHLIHGDLLDAADRAPFDFLYLSNALEHTGRPADTSAVATAVVAAATRTSTYQSPRRRPAHAPFYGGPAPAHPEVERLSSLLRKGSRVLWVAAQGPSYGGNLKAAQAWTLTRAVRGYRTSWVYNLSRQA